MNIAHLRYAVEVEKTSSITKAADNLYMGQPNVSKAIKELEASLGITIFRRTSKGVMPTQKGREFLNYAKGIIVQIDEMESMYKVRRQDKISFAISVPRASYIAHAFTRFVGSLDHDKMLELNYCETNSLDTIDNVTRDEFRLGIIRYPLSQERYYLNLLADRDVLHHAVWDFPHLLLMSKDHPLALREAIQVSDLSHYMEIKHGDLSIPSPSAATAQPDIAHRRIYIYERGSQVDLLNHIPSSYMWGSPLPDELLERYRMVQRRCEGMDQSHRDEIIYAKGYKLSKLDKAFITELTTVKQALAAQVYK